MIRIILAMAVLQLMGCGTMQSKMPWYTEPVSGPYATVYPHGNLRNATGYKLRKLHLEIFDGCFSGRDYAKENVLGDRSFKDDTLNKSTLRIPAGKRLYFKYGSDYSQWVCHAQFSFVPNEGGEYKFDFKRNLATCEVLVTDYTTGQPIDVTWYEETGTEKLLMSTALDWRKCENLGDN